MNTMTFLIVPLGGSIEQGERWMMDLFESEHLKVVLQCPKQQKQMRAFQIETNTLRTFCFQWVGKKNLYAVNITKSNNWDVCYFCEIWTKFNPFYKSKNEKVGLLKCSQFFGLLGTCRAQQQHMMLLDIWTQHVFKHHSLETIHWTRTPMLACFMANITNTRSPDPKMVEDLRPCWSHVTIYQWFQLYNLDLRVCVLSCRNTQ